MLTEEVDYSPSATCNQPTANRRQVIAEGPHSEWTIHKPRELRPGPFAPQIYRKPKPGAPALSSTVAAAAAVNVAGGHHGPVKEKNWMPFVAGGQLYMTYSVVPHRVFRWGGEKRGWRRAVGSFVGNEQPGEAAAGYTIISHTLHPFPRAEHSPHRMNSQGVAVQQFVTNSSALSKRFAGEDVHGGPPLVLITPSLPQQSAPQQKQQPDKGRRQAPYYLGVLHFFQTTGVGADRVKHYHHHAYRMEAAAPFRICGVSKEIPLVTRKKEAGQAQHARWARVCASLVCGGGGGGCNMPLGMADSAPCVPPYRRDDKSILKTN
jgi:hypothetical protein